jgi:hypothetical protein
VQVERFRKQKKVTIQANIPVKVAEEVGYLSVSHKRPDNETITSLLCTALGLDPHDFGIENPVTASRN